VGYPRAGPRSNGPRRAGRDARPASSSPSCCRAGRLRVSPDGAIALETENTAPTPGPAAHWRRRSPACRPARSGRPAGRAARRRRQRSAGGSVPAWCLPGFPPESRGAACAPPLAVGEPSPRWRVCPTGGARKVRPCAKRAMWGCVRAGTRHGRCHGLWGGRDRPHRSRAGSHSEPHIDLGGVDRLLQGGDQRARSNGVPTTTTSPRPTPGSELQIERVGQEQEQAAHLPAPGRAASRQCLNPSPPERSPF
jgi:hypothetical protein